MMFIHAYQSYLWNTILSERIRRFGCDKPIVGDLIYASDVADGAEEAIPTLEDDDLAVDVEVAAVSTTGPAEDATKANGKLNAYHNNVYSHRLRQPSHLDRETPPNIKSTSSQSTD